MAIDLKIGDFGYQDAGQMHFYLSYIAERLTRPDENPPVGILLCAGKDAEKVHFATANLPHRSSSLAISPSCPPKSSSPGGCTRNRSAS